MKEAILPAFDFFEHVECRYSIGPNHSSLDDTSPHEPLRLESLTDADKAMWAQAQSISFLISLSQLKADYAMQNVSTALTAHIQFFAQNYSFQAKKYAYGSYPSSDDIHRALEEQKKAMIDIIEKAIKIITLKIKQYDRLYDSKWL